MPKSSGCKGFSRAASISVQSAPSLPLWRRPECRSELTLARIAAADIIVDYNGTARVSAGDDRLQPGSSDEQLDAVLAAIERGTPYIGIHAASVRFPGQLPMTRAGERVYARDVAGLRPLWQQPPANRAVDAPLPASPAEQAAVTEAQRRYVSMVGSAFISHQPLARFRVPITDREYPITHGVADFEIEDEWYELAGDRLDLDLAEPTLRIWPSQPAAARKTAATGPAVAANQPQVAEMEVVNSTSKRAAPPFTPTRTIAPPCAAAATQSASGCGTPAVRTLRPRLRHAQRR